jgi:hypothetical protein
MKNIAKAKCAANTQRNRQQSIRRFAKANAPRRSNGNILLGFVPGAPLVPVLDLLHLGGPERVRCIRHHVPGGLQQRAVEFHNKVAAAFAVAEGKA